MKKTIAILLFALAAGGCHKNDDNMSKAVLLSQDLTLCACCGGLVVSFDNDAQPENGTIYHAREYPQNSITTDVQSPVKVYIQWEPDSFQYGREKFIKIRSIMRR